MKMRRRIVSILCLIMAIARFSAPVEAVQAEVSYDEATVLDQMANSWSETCKTNLVYCQMGLLKEIFAQPFESSKDAIKEQLLKDILTGYQGKTNIWCEIDVNKFYDQLDDPGSLQDDIRTYLTTSADAEDLEERALHFRAKTASTI